MCNPTLMLISGIGSAFMQYQQGQAQSAAMQMEAENNRRIMEFNAKQNEISATQAIRKGAQDAGVIRENARRSNATARARLSSAGLDADVGTPATLIDQNVQMGETNAMTAMRDAELEAMGFKNTATGQRFQGEVGVSNAKYSSRIARQKGLLDASGTLITAGGNYGKSKGWFG